MNGDAKRLFCFGLGFSALTLARHLMPRGFAFAGTCRSGRKADELRAKGIEAHIFAEERPFNPEALAGTTHLLLSVPPDDEGDPVFRAHGGDIAEIASGLQWVGYLSTTGVYGDRAGKWVDEASPLAPTTGRGDRRLRAEEQWRSLGLPLHIFRLAGIYGPGRNQLRSVADGSARRIVKAGQVFSRVHVEDVAAALAASMTKPNPGAAYNVCDDEPAPPQDVVAFAAGLLQLPLPPEVAFEDAQLSPMARSFYEDSKRVSNRRMREELNVGLRYPTYREGLRALLETDRPAL
ncbi:MAG TPA: SDR family oxidoreductase [Parvibaculum sp.]